MEVIVLVVETIVDVEKGVLDVEVIVIGDVIVKKIVEEATIVTNHVPTAATRTLRAKFLKWEGII